MTTCWCCTQIGWVEFIYAITSAKDLATSLFVISDSCLLCKSWKRKSWLSWSISDIEKLSVSRPKWLYQQRLSVTLSMGVRRKLFGKQTGPIHLYLSSSLGFVALSLSTFTVMHFSRSYCRTAVPDDWVLAWYCRLSVTKCIVAKRYILHQKCLNKWIGNAPRDTILQFSTPYTDHIPSNSSLKCTNFTYLLCLAFLITWPFLCWDNILIVMIIN